MNEPLKHHYIPQFILRNFCNENNLVWYWDNNKKYLSERNTKSVFMNELMYKRDDVSDEISFEVENNLAKFEQEISILIKDKILNKTDIQIDRKELEKLRIFLMLLSFRSDLRMKQYKGGNFNESTQNLLDSYKDESDYVQFWKKEINELACCRSFEDIENCKIVDPIIQQDFYNLLKGCYMTIVDARGQDFILSDVYPTLEIFPLYEGCNLHLHHFYPISPSRAIVLNMITFKKLLRDKSDPLLSPLVQFSHIKGELLKEPFVKYKRPGICSPEDIFCYHVPKIYKDDVTYIDMLIFNEVRNGFIFKDASRIKEALETYNTTNVEYNKNNYGVLLEKLSEN